MLAEVRRSTAVVACWSCASANRERSGQWAELHLAVDESQWYREDRRFLFPVLLDDCALPDLLRRFQYLKLFPDAEWRARIQKLVAELRRVVTPARLPSTPAVTDRSQSVLTRPTPLQRILDRTPAVHEQLCKWGIGRRPPEWQVFNRYLSETRARIVQKVERDSAYLPLDARDVPRHPTDAVVKDPFERRVHQVIRQVAGLAEGGDSADARIAAVNRRSKAIRNIHRTLIDAKEPVVLLGEPGSGKTMTLQHVAVSLLDAEKRRAFPRLVVFLRLGEWSTEEASIDPASVVAYVAQHVPADVSGYLDSLDAERRLIVLFDGMDEMSRRRYNERVGALSQYALAHQEGTRTLFSCRINDFSPEFVHRRLVLLPFDTAQVVDFLKKNLPGTRVTIDGASLSLREFAARLQWRDLPFDAHSPFVLSLLCLFIANHERFPASRMELMEEYVRRSFTRAFGDRTTEPPYEEAYEIWATLAFLITNRNAGTTVEFGELEASLGAHRPLRAAIVLGRRCGVLAEVEDHERCLLRFAHHRMQEFFAARHIATVRPEIDWSAKLTVPRWQETLVNLAVSDVATPALQFLVETMTADTRQLTPKPAKKKLRRSTEWARESDDNATARDETPASVAPAVVPPVEEPQTIVHDRLVDSVELAASIARNSQGHDQTTRVLEPVMRDSIALLSMHGNPIAQVKMLGVCQTLPALASSGAIERALSSPIAWVRHQALIVLANTPTPSVDLADRVLVDLVTGQLALRLKTYAKAAASSHSLRNWWAFAAGLLCYLLFIGGLAAGAAALYIYGRSVMVSVQVGGSIDIVPAAAVIAAATVVASLLTLRQSEPLVWLPILGVPVASLFAMSAIELVWRGTWGPVQAAVNTVVGGAAAFTAFGIAANIWLLVVAAALAATRGRMKSRQVVVQLVREGADAAGFSVAWMLAMGLVALGIFTAVPVMLAGYLAARFVGVDVALVARVVGLLLLGGGALAFAANLVKRDGDRFSLFSPLIYVGFGLMLAFDVRAWLARIGSFGTLALYVGRVLAFVLALAIAALFIWMVRETSRLVGRSVHLWWYRGFGRIRDRDVWKTEFTAASPDDQAFMLRLTSATQLRLDAAQYVGLLEEVESAVTSEPALSAYWSRRHEIAQIARQART
jgi:hypothetical protein